MAMTKQYVDELVTVDDDDNNAGARDHRLQLILDLIEQVSNRIHGHVRGRLVLVIG